ncbi:thiazolylpeptide-type bacteriocin [Dactylosporangium sp. CA-092794]|uniref:thiazolylpeptide-type bacteriocin n=1 Tax=Dactylosporangium sp. CA-092794 TaxID=3239929 RepID=UPI003D8C4810
MPAHQLKTDLLQVEAETFEILDVATTTQDLADAPVDFPIVDDGSMSVWCSSSCSCSSCCSCSTSSCCSTSTSTSSCG